LEKCAVPVIPQLVETITRRQSSQPRTILGFILGICTLFVVVVVAVSIPLISNHIVWLVGVMLLVVAVIFVWLLAAVIRQAKSDPAGLMLGQVTGDEYHRIRALNMGDSSGGERTVVGPVQVTDPDAIEATASDVAASQTLGPGDSSAVEDPDVAT
jgi:hypothetical protein